MVNQKFTLKMGKWPTLFTEQHWNVNAEHTQNCYKKIHLFNANIQIE